MKYGLVIFDCDGTLIDTATDVAHCFNIALDACGFSPCSYETIAALIGGPLEMIVEELIKQSNCRHHAEDITRVAAEYRKAYESYSKPNTRPFPGMAELVLALIGGGVKVGIHSNKPEKALITLAKQHFEELPLQIWGYTTGRPVKPHPGGVIGLLDATGLGPDDAAYVGDTSIDYSTAKNANIDCFIMTWGQGGREFYENLDPAISCTTASELAWKLGFHRD